MQYALHLTYNSNLVILCAQVALTMLNVQSMSNPKGLHEIFYCWKEIIQLSSLHNLATAQWELSWESVGKRLRLTLLAMAC